MGLLDFILGTNQEPNNKEDLENFTDEEKQAYQKAIDTEGESLVYESYDLRNNKEFIMALLKSDKKINIKEISDNLKNDKEIIILSLKQKPDNIQYASYELKNNEEVVKEVVRNHDGMLTGYEGENILNNYDFMINIIRDYKWENIKYVNNELKNNKDFCREASKTSYKTKEYFGENVLSDTEFMKDIEIYM